MCLLLLLYDDFTLYYIYHRNTVYLQKYAIYVMYVARFSSLKYMLIMLHRGFSMSLDCYNVHILVHIFYYLFNFPYISRKSTYIQDGGPKNVILTSCLSKNF